MTQKVDGILLLTEKSRSLVEFKSEVIYKILI